MIQAPIFYQMYKIDMQRCLTTTAAWPVLVAWAQTCLKAMSTRSYVYLSKADAHMTQAFPMIRPKTGEVAGRYSMPTVHELQGKRR